MSVSSKLQDLYTENKILMTTVFQEMTPYSFWQPANKLHSTASRKAGMFFLTAVIISNLREQNEHLPVYDSEHESFPW